MVVVVVVVVLKEGVEMGCRYPRQAMNKGWLRQK
jgi:hypothetical protein